MFPAVEGMKVVEIEKCRNDIKKLREEMVSRNNRCARSDSTETHHKLACVSPALTVLSELKCCCFFLFFFSHFQQLPGGQQEIDAAQRRPLLP